MDRLNRIVVLAMMLCGLAMGTLHAQGTGAPTERTQEGSGRSHILQSWDHRAVSVAFSPDARHIAIGSGENSLAGHTYGKVFVYDISTGRKVWSREWTPVDRAPCRQTRLMMLALIIYSPWAFAPCHWLDEFDGNLHVTFSANGASLIASAYDGTRTYDAPTGRIIAEERAEVARKGDTSWWQRWNGLPGAVSSLAGVFVATASASTVFVTVGAGELVFQQAPSLRQQLRPRDQFESTAEYDARVRSATSSYTRIASTIAHEEASRRTRAQDASRRRVSLSASSVVLGEYNADNFLFPVTVQGIVTELELPPDEARELAQRRSEIIVEAVEQLGPDLTTRQRLNLQLVHPTTLKRYPIGRQVALPEVAMVVTKPAALEVLDPRFTDSDGDNRLGAGERALLEFTVRNTGEGPGQGLRVVGTGSAPIEGLSASIGRIEPGESKRVSLTLVGGATLTDGTAALQVEVKEANGFNAPPLVVRVPTWAFRPPSLEVAEVGVEDAQGRALIRTGQVVTLTVRVRNAGAGRATGVVADVVPGPGVFLGETPDPRRAVLRVGDLEAGAFRDVRVKAFANAEVRGAFPLAVELREVTGRFTAASKDLGLTLETPQRSVAQLEVSAREVASKGASGAATAPRLVSDLLDGIPTARAERPDAIAVIIGNRSYQSAPSVAFAANDAAVMRQYAERTLGIKPGNVLYLEDATLTNLQVVFGREGNPEGRLKDLVRPGVTEVFVFYSGHGAPDVRGQKAYLMPVDADASRLALTGFSVDALYANLAALGAKHVTVVLDACFSGATGSGEMLITEASPLGIRVSDPAARFAAGGATILTAATGQQLANWYPEQRHGLFTYFFLKGLQGSADANRDGALTVDEMRAWLTAPTGGVPEASRRLYGTNREQVPQVWGDAARRIR